MSTTSAFGASEPLPMRDDSVPSWQLLLTLTVAGALAGLAVVLLYDWTRPRVEAHKAGVLREAIAEVLHSPRRADTLWLTGGKLSGNPPSGENAKTAERVYLGSMPLARPPGTQFRSSSQALPTRSRCSLVTTQPAASCSA